MRRKNILTIIGVASVFVTSAQATPLDFNQLATNCRLVIEKNELKNQKYEELAILTAELESYTQLWRNLCYEAIENANTTVEDITYLIDNTIPGIDDEQLLSDLNNALQGKPVTGQAATPNPQPSEPKKADTPKEQVRHEPPVTNEPQKDIKEKSGNELQPEPEESTQLESTKKANDPETTVVPEKKDDKPALRPDELIKQKRKRNNNKEHS